MTLASSLAEGSEVLSECVQGVIVAALSHSNDVLRHTALRAIEILGGRVLVKKPSITAALLVACQDKEHKISNLAQR